MLRNYIKIAFRSLLKNRTFSIINICGLAIGLASSILIFLWVADEYAYDTFHPNYENIYQVYMKSQWNGHIGTQNSLPYRLKEALLEKSSKIKYSVMTNWGEGNMLQVGDKRLNKNGISASEDFFKIFGYKFLAGNPNTALNEPTKIVITQSTAKAFFKDEDAINKNIRIDNGYELKVSGVIADLPKQSFLQIDYVLPFSFYEKTNEWVKNSKDGWDNNSFQIYVLLQAGVASADVDNAIGSIVKNNNPKSPSAEVFLHPMSKWRLHSNWEEGVNTGGQIIYVRLFTCIAVFVLIIACINFMNLATARSESRAREVGIRKSIGSRRKELIAQFLGESIAVTCIAFLLAIVIVELLLPGYNLLVKKNILIDYANPTLWVGAIGLILVIGLLSGSYPSFYLSSFNAVQVLKGKVNIGKGASTPRKVLVTLQFGFSIFLIIGTIVIYQQIQHVKNRDIGYDKENLIQIWTNGELEKNFQTVREELLRTNVVQSVCKSNSPVTSIFSNNEVKWSGKIDETRMAFTTIATEYDYTKTMGVKILEGRDFSPDFKSDSAAVIVNEAAVKIMGMKNPIGQKIEIWDSKKEIIGVIEDMVMDSPYKPVQPLTMIFIPGWSSTITIRLNKTDEIAASIAKIEAVFKKLNPSYPFQYRFADDDFEKKFSSINLISRLAGIFAALAIFITCLGLFGLAAFTAEQRTKEVGIRKVMGASVSSLVLMISKDFSKLVIFAFLISAPIAWWFINDFLQQYEYRTKVAWWVLLGAGAFALILALVIVSAQALKAAVANPSKSLRSE
jgi:predicted permease